MQEESEHKINRIAFKDEGKGIPLIFIHAFPLDSSMWKTTSDALKSKYRIITPDLRGFGNSTTEEKITIDIFGDDIVSLLDSLSIPKAVMCGISLGGYIALNIAARYADRLNGIILCNTHCFADDADTKKSRKKNIELINESGLKDFAENLAPKLLGKNAGKQLFSRITQLIMKQDSTAVCKTLAAMAERKETCSILSQIHVPCLIVHSTDDQIIKQDKAEYLNHGIISSEMQVIENAGHLSNMENAAAFNDIIGNFIYKEFSHPGNL